MRISRTFSLEVPDTMPKTGDYLESRGKYGRVEGYEIELAATNHVLPNVRLSPGLNLRYGVVMRLRVAMKLRGRMQWASACQLLTSKDWPLWRPVPCGHEGLAEVLRQITDDTQTGERQRYGNTFFGSADETPEKGR